jgi:omega-hydroxy-beta-dihydromenaquinone-9 sulfotransferase
MPRSDYLRFGHRRLRFYAAFAFLAPLHLGVTWICLALDHLFFPGFRRVEIHSPLFILGNFRSGSTFLYRRLARDTTGFAAFSTREIYLTPSISQRKLWALARRIDARFGAPIRNFIHSFDDRVLEAVPYHKVGLSEPEEDEGLFFYRWGSFFTWFFFPGSSRALPIVSFDRLVAPARRRRLMRFYRRCVQRHLYVHGPDKHFLSKNPAFTGKLRSLRRHFPDARIVCLVRNPVDLVPSMINWFSVAWSYFGDTRTRYLFPELIRDIAHYWYRYPLDVVAGDDPGSLRFLSFERLTGSFAEVAEELYRFVGHPGDPHARGVVPQPEEVTERARGLTPEAVGLSTEDIDKRFREVMDAYRRLPPDRWIAGPGS